MRLFAFDLDGTLVDSRRDIAASANAALSAVGLPPRELDEVASFVGGGARRLVSLCVGERQDLLEPALEAWKAHYDEHLLDTTVPFPGVPAALATLASHGVLAVATNKPGQFARRICEALFPGRFVAVIGGDEAPRKPDPTMVKDLLRHAGCAAEAAAYVGDMDVDRATAEAAGVRFVGVAWGYGSARLPGPLARDAAELVQLVSAPR